MLGMSLGAHSGLTGSRRRRLAQEAVVRDRAASLLQGPAAPLLRSRRDIHGCRDAGLGGAQAQFPAGPSHAPGGRPLQSIVSLIGKPCDSQAWGPRGSPGLTAPYSTPAASSPQDLEVSVSM